MPEKLKLTDLKRRAIIKAATSEFHRNGYEATSMDRIAATANVSKRTVYNHFSSKQKLFDAIISELVNRIPQYDSVSYDPGRPLKAQFYELVREEIEFVLSKSFIKLAQVVTSELFRTPATANAFWEDGNKKRTAMFFWIQDAAADGRLTVQSVEIANRQLGGLLREFIFWPQLLGGQKAPSKDELDEIVNSAVDIFLKYYETKK